MPQKEPVMNTEPTQMPGNDTPAEITQKPDDHDVAGITQKPDNGLLWFQEDNGAFVVSRDGELVIQSHDWGNVLMYAHRNKLPLAFSKKSYRVGNFPLEGGTPVLPSNWCPADRIRKERPGDIPQQKNEGHYENYIAAVHGLLRSGRVFDVSKDLSKSGPAGPTVKALAELNVKGPAEPTKAR